MCGIYGWQWKKGSEPSIWRRTALAILLAQGNAKRGEHSWGMFSPAVGVKKGLGSIKSVMHVARKFDSFFAHTRYATHGSKTVENAHPFEVGGLVGAHNGIIYNHEDLKLKYNRSFEVDSQHIFAHLDAGLPLDELEGYGTAEWYAKDHPERLFIARLTDSGELTAVQTQYGVIWSSDEKHLDEALEAAAMKGDKLEVKAGRVHSVLDGTLYIRQEECGISSRKVDKRTSGYDGLYSGWDGYSEGYGYNNSRYMNYGGKIIELPHKGTVVTSDGGTVSDEPTEEELLEMMDADYASMDYQTLRELWWEGDKEAEKEFWKRGRERDRMSGTK